jgi:hypothetical protein
MALKPTSRQPVGQQRPTPRRPGRPVKTPALPLPHERDESLQSTPMPLDPVMVQARRDIDAGLVDTDMRATPGLDAARRASMVPGPGGRPPSLVPSTLARQHSDFTAEGSPPPAKPAGPAKAKVRRA